MLTVLDILIFFSFVVLLVALIAQNDNNIKPVLKVQARSCIVGLTLEVISLVVRFLLARYWVPVFVVLIVHAIISVVIIIDAKDYGVFEKKKKTNNNVNVDVVV